MSFSSNISSTALKLITKYGTPIVITTIGQGIYNPSTASVTNTLNVPLQTFGVIEEYPDSIRTYGDKVATNTAIIDGDKKVTIAGASVTIVPKAGDKVTVSGIDYNVIGIASQYVQAIVAYYVLHIRKV